MYIYSCITCSPAGSKTTGPLAGGSPYIYIYICKCTYICLCLYTYIYVYLYMCQG